MEVRELGPHVYLRPDVDNSLWADLGDGAVVVDGLEHWGLAPVIAQEVRKSTGREIRWVVNTHWHRDHTACNPAWAREGATVVAHESVAPATEAHDGMPNVTFRDRYTLRGSERQVELEWLGGTHTPEDSVVWFPWARVLHTGDLFGWGLIPLARLDAEGLGRLREVYGRMLAYDAAVVVPGHGPTLTPAHLRRFIEYVDDLVARVPALRRSGASAEEVARQVPPPDDMQGWWRFTDWKHARNLERLREAGL